MDRHDLQSAPRAPRLPAPDKGAFVAGILLIAAAVVTAVIGEDAGGIARVLGSAGLVAVATCAAARGVRAYRVGVTAALPTSVARVQVRVRPARGFNALTVALALVAPLAGAVAFLVLVEWAWLPLDCVVSLGCAAGIVTWRRDAREASYFMEPPETARALLDRLCMRADMRVPELVVEGSALASWTVGGRIHLSRWALKLLDDAELEAVLAHEVAHLARRDAAVMEICSAPSGVLLAFSGYLTPRVWPWLRGLASTGISQPIGAIVLAALCIPPAVLIGWMTRLSVLGMSRAREFSADAAAATLTGRPSALASALLKLDRQRDWAPRADLRQVEAYAVLGIVGRARSGLGRLVSTHPPTAARVRRLEELEARMQAVPAR